MQIPDGMTREQYDRYRSDGFDDEGIARIGEIIRTQREVHRQYAARQERDGPREITCSTYERAQAGLRRDVDAFLGRRL